MDDLRSTVNVLNELLDLHASRRPNENALTDGTARLTWRQYRDRSSSLAGALRDVGVHAGDRVAIHLPKSVDSFVSVHAVLRLGAIVVPIDWFAPAAHARSVITDAEVTAIISSASAEVLGGLLDDVRGDTSDRPRAIPPTSAGPAVARTVVAPTDGAYIVYTSGSTGRPKGIVHTHASSLAYATAAVDTYELTAADRLANIAPLHFDQSTFELYAAPLAGAAVVVLSDVVLRFPASAAKLIEQERVTVWYSVPYAITQLTERGAVTDRDLTSLRWVLYGGESFPPGALAASMRALPTARFSNVYGPAEVNQCTFHHLDTPPATEAPIPIGAAWPVADLLLVDEEGAVIDDQTPGHLLVSTDTMMDRYWRRDDLTAASIVTMRDPRLTDEAAPRRWYRTGDRVERRSDGEFVFLGRFDHQVKVRGHRIELEAVEAVVIEHGAVDDCAVMVERGVDGANDQLVAAVSPAANEATLADVKLHVRARLPRYAVPTEIIGLAVIPRTGNGKVDRPAVGEALAAHQKALPVRSTESDGRR
jgi:amino acid adenylation domain-containing protein